MECPNKGLLTECDVFYILYIDNSDLELARKLQVAENYMYISKCKTVTTS